MWQVVETMTDFSQMIAGVVDKLMDPTCSKCETQTRAAPMVRPQVGTEL